MRKIWKKLKNYPELLGIGAVCILVGIIFLYKLEVRREYGDRYRGYGQGEYSGWL